MIASKLVAMAATGRILRSHSGKAAVASAKAVESKLNFKSKKIVNTDAEKLKSVAQEKRGGKREGEVQPFASEDVVGKAEKRSRKSNNKSVVVVVAETPLSAAFTEAVLPTVQEENSTTILSQAGTLSQVKCSWSISLSSAESLAEATKFLTAADAKLGSIIASHGQGPKFEKCDGCFVALVRSIVYQELAGKAAATIHGRLVALCGGPDCVTPAVIAALTVEQLREVGVSGCKATYLHDLAKHFLSGALSDEELVMMNEDKLVKVLTVVKGIGVWSAHMFMIFYLHKPDVLPVGDLAIRKGFQTLYRLKALPSVIEMEQLASSWRPYRSLASWYLWRVKETMLPVA